MGHFRSENIKGAGLGISVDTLSAVVDERGMLVGPGLRGSDRGEAGGGEYDCTQ